MISNKAILQSLPLLASVLGKSYGVRVEIGGNQAFTNGSVIQLPSLPAESDNKFTGLVRAYIDHESAHIRETDFSVLQGMTPLEKNIWNIFEDWRVENRLAAIFPGCRQNFNWMIRHMFVEYPDEELTKVSAVTILNWLLLTVRSWDVKDLIPKCNMLRFVLDVNWWGLSLEIDAILDRMKSNCPDSFACLGYAREVIELLHKEAEKEESPEKQDDQGEQAENQNQGNNSADSESQEPENESPNNNGSSTEFNEESKNDNPGHSSTSIDECGNDKTNDQNQKIEWLFSAPESELPEDLGKSIARSIETQTENSSLSQIVVARLGSKRLKELDPDSIAALRTVTAGMRSRFHALLQSTNLTQKLLSRKGRVDTGKLYRVAIENPRIFMRQGEKQAINTAVHILLDCSSSMSERIQLATNVCQTVAKSLESVGVSIGVTAFPGDADRANSQFCTVAPIVRHGQKVHSRFQISSSGSTPMGESLWWVLQEMITLKEKRKLILIITDGDPDSKENTLEVIKTGQCMDMEFYGVGIDAPAICGILPESSININSLSELAPAMFKMLRQALVK